VNVECLNESMRGRHGHTAMIVAGLFEVWRASGRRQGDGCSRLALQDVTTLGGVVEASISMERRRVSGSGKHTAVRSQLGLDRGGYRGPRGEMS
jgi:hypothetical protein